MAKAKSSGASPRVLRLRENNRFLSAAELGLEPVSEWDRNSFPIPPRNIRGNRAISELKNGLDVVDNAGRTIRFDSGIMKHWEVRNKTEKDFKSRLELLDMAVDTVQSPREVWHQGKQRAYVKAYKGDKRNFGFKVFVSDDNITITYFPCGINKLQNARKGTKFER